MSDVEKCVKCDNCGKMSPALLIHLHSSTGLSWNKFTDFCCGKCLLKFLQKNPEYARNAHKLEADDYTIRDFLINLNGVKSKEVR